MSVLITGGISKVTIQLAETLIGNGRNVVFLHNGVNELIPSNLLQNSLFTLVNLSSVNEDGIKNLIEIHKIQTVFDGSLTTSDVLLEPLQGARKLILGITSILDAIRKSTSPPSFVLISGEEVYGNSSNRVETQPLEPVTFIGSAQMSVEAMVHSYAVSYRIPIVIGRLPNILVSSKSDVDSKLKTLDPEIFVNILSISDATRGLLSIEKLAQSQKPAEVYNISNSVDFLGGNFETTQKSKFSNTKILSETDWKPSEIPTSSENFEDIVVKPVFLIYGADEELKNQFSKLVKIEGLLVKESSITNLQEASDKLVLEEINKINPSHLVYFGNETESFEGDCFILRTNMATNLYFPWLLASIAEKQSIHFTHFGNTSISQETSSDSVKGFTGKMLEYFENTLKLGQKIDKNALELIKGGKRGTLNNNI